MDLPSCLPQQPKDSDCCGQGCQSCVFDIYEKEMAIWIKRTEGVTSNSDCMTPDGYTVCTIEKVEAHSPNVFIFHLKCPPKIKLTFFPGQHLMVRENLIETESIARAYTPITPPGTVTTFLILIKLYEGGPMSSIIRKKWLPGHIVACRGPIGKHVYRPNSFHTVVMVAMGSGITPLFQIACSVKENSDDETRVVILYGCKVYSKILLRQQLHEMQGYWNFRIRYYLSEDNLRTADARRKHNEEIIYRRVSVSDVMQEIEKVPGNQRFSVFICGSKSFERQMIEDLSASGVPRDAIHTFN